MYIPLRKFQGYLCLYFIVKKTHEGSPSCVLIRYYSPDTYGSNAIVRARLIATVNLR